MNNYELDSKYLEEGIYNCAIKNKKYFIILIIISSLLKFQSSNLYVISFLLAIPQIECDYNFINNNSEKYKIKCTVENVCKWNNYIKLELKKNSKNYTKNDLITYNYSKLTNNEFSLITYYNIECNHNASALLGSMWTLGTAIFTIFYPFSQIYLGDAFTIKICVTLSLIFYIILLFFRSYYVQILSGIFVFGVSPLYTNNFSVYFNDFCPKESRGFWIMILNILFPFSGLIFSLIFYIFRSWIVLRIVTLVVLIPTSIIIYILLVDNPMYYLNNNNLEKAIYSLHKISIINNSECEFLSWKTKLDKINNIDNNKKLYKINKTNNDENEFLNKDNNCNIKLEDNQFDIGNKLLTNEKEKDKLLNELAGNNNLQNTVKKTNKKSLISTFKIIFKIKEETILFLIMCILSFHLGFARNYISVQITIVDNIYFVSTLFFLIEIVTFYIQALYSDIDIGGRKNSLKFLFFIGFVSISYEAIMTITKGQFYTNIIVLLIIRISQEIAVRMTMGIGSEIYSRDIVSWTFGFNLFISRFIGIFGVYLIIVNIKIGLICLALLNLLCFILVFSMKEVKNSKIYNTLEEKYNI